MEKRKIAGSRDLLAGATVAEGDERRLLSRSIANASTAATSFEDYLIAG